MRIESINSVHFRTDFDFDLMWQLDPLTPIVKRFGRDFT